MKLAISLVILAMSLFAQTRPQATQLKAPAGAVRVLVFSVSGGAQLATFDSTITLNNGVLSCTVPPPAPLTLKTVTGSPDANGQWVLPSAPSQMIVLTRNGVVLTPLVDYVISSTGTVAIGTNQGYSTDDMLLAVYAP
jgi:hypothetical protein